MNLVWYNARIRDGELWSDLPAGSKVLVARSGHDFAAGTVWWVFNGKRLRAVTEPLASKAFARKKLHSDQDECRTRVLPFLKAHALLLGPKMPKK